MQVKSGLVTFFALCGLVVFSSTLSHAQGNLATSATAKKSAVKKPFSIAAGVATSRNLYDFQDGSLRESMDVELIPSYKWSLARTSLVMSYSHDNRRPENSDLNDIIIANSFAGWDFSTFKLNPSLNLTLPQSKVSRELRNLEGALSGKLVITPKAELMIKGVSFYAGVSINRSFHRYETALNGALNNQYSSRQALGAGYSFQRYSFSVDFGHNNAWSYQGNMREAYDHTEEASVGISDNYAFAIGHTNGGSVFKANGYDSNYKLIDENSSMIYAKLSLQY